MKLSQIFIQSLQSIRTNKLRTSLTILGIVVGIFSIIVIMTVITMLQISIEEGLSQLNKNTFQIQKNDPTIGSGPRFRAQRPDITIEDMYRLKEMLKDAKYVAAEQWQFGKVIKYRNRETNPNIQIAGITVEAMKTNNWNIEKGRELRDFDVQYSADVCILGKDVVEKLFPNINPIGQYVRVDKKNLLVIGLLEKQPSLFGQSRDNVVILPITTWQNMFGKYGRTVNITVMSYGKEDYNDLIDAAIGHMRTIRKLKPSESNNFYIYSNESLIGQVNDITEPIKIGSIAVSLIALIAAGVGIMNIMLVSVTERTREIGIRKSLGARKNWILLQFLFEAVILCLIGGIVGIILGVGIGNIAGSYLNAQTAIPFDWVVIGILLCIIVGVAFGTYPAYKAANLDPIEALRYE
jgi:putative ABC transport system permease protein